MENKTSKYAVASLVLGISTMLLFPTIIFSIPTGILAIVFGVMAKNEDHGTNQSNKGLGIGGIATGSVGLFLTLLFLIYFLFVVLLGYMPRSGHYEYDPYNHHDDMYDHIYDYEYYFQEIE